MCLYYCTKKKLVSSANIIGTNTFEELGRSFTYNKNNGTSIEPCDTPHLITFFIVSTDSVSSRIQQFSYTVSYHLSNWQTKQDSCYWDRTFLVFLAILNDRWYQMLWINLRILRVRNYHFQRTRRFDKRGGQEHGLQNDFFGIETALSILICLLINIFCNR